MAQNLKIQSEDIYNYKSEQNSHQVRYIKIPYIEAKPSAAAGESLIVDRKIQSFFAFDIQWIYSKGRPANMGVMKIMGDSMFPTIPDGSLILVDRSQTELVQKKIFVVEHDQGIKVKRLKRDSEKNYILMSDNELEEDIKVDPTIHFRILGKVIWVSYEL